MSEYVNVTFSEGLAYLNRMAVYVEKCAAPAFVQILSVLMVFAVVYFLWAVTRVIVYHMSKCPFCDATDKDESDIEQVGRDCWKRGGGE